MLFMIKDKKLYLDGILITGTSDFREISGEYLITLNNTASPYTAELYVPSTGVLCSLPKLPDKRYWHTMDKSGLLCGGLGGELVSDSCTQWSPDTGTWKKLLTLDVRRWGSVSWTPGTGNGTYLIGGGSKGAKTTTLIRPDGTQMPGFPLEYSTE